MPDPKPGKEVPADAPTEVSEADVADPGEMAKIKAKQREEKKGKHGSAKVDKASEDDEEDEKTWVEFQLIDAGEQPVKDEKCKLTLPDGSQKELPTNGKGVVRVNDLDSDLVTIRFLDRWDYEWKFLRVEESKG